MNCDSISIWVEHQQELHFFINKKVHQEEDAKDILQEVYLKLYKVCNTGIDIQNERAWLYRVTKNAIADYYRRGNKIVSNEERLMDKAIEEESDNMQSAARYVGPLINRLPLEYALPLRLDTLVGLNQDAIAKQLNIGHGTLRTRLFRARKMLKEKILECAELEVDSAGKISDFAIKPECNFLQSQN